MTVIFAMEYHPVGAPARRIRILAAPDSDRIRCVTEQRRDGQWAEVNDAFIDYFEYADESERA